MHIHFTSPLAVIDLETTGLNQSKDRIVEIAILFFDTGLQPTGEFTTLINPGRDTGARFIHGISNSAVRDAPRFAEISTQLAQLLSQRIVVAHNVRFDIGFLNAEFARAQTDFQISYSRSICTMDQSHIYCKPGSHSLLGLVERLGIKLIPKHRALDDARAAARLLHHYSARECQGKRYTNMSLDRNGRQILPNKLLVQACSARLF